jgi:hypothetical protein
MNLFDLLRGVVPGTAQLLARNFQAASATPMRFSLSDPSIYGGFDGTDPMPSPDFPDVPVSLLPSPLPAFPDRPGLPRLMLLPDRLDRPASPEPILGDEQDPSFGDIHAQLLAGAASRIGPGDLAMNRGGWAPSMPGSGSLPPVTLQPMAPIGLPAFAARAGSTVSPIDVVARPQFGWGLADLPANAGPPDSLAVAGALSAGQRQSDAIGRYPPDQSASPALPGRAFDWSTFDGGGPSASPQADGSLGSTGSDAAREGSFAPGLSTGAAVAPGIPYAPGLSAGEILAAAARFGGPLAFLTTLLYPSSTAADDTCENSRCNSVFNAEKPRDPPPPEAEDDAASAKGDATTQEGAPFSWIHKDRYTNNERLKARHEDETGEVWPTDPETGHDMQVSHEDALADGGMDHVSNIRPRTESDHRELHMKAGDFARWRRRRGQNP